MLMQWTIQLAKWQVYQHAEEDMSISIIAAPRMP